METDQTDVANASEETTNVGGNPSAEEHRQLSPHTDNHIYRQDIVRHNTQSLGVVTEVAGDSDSDSNSDSDSESDSSDDEDNDDDVEDSDEGDKEDKEGVEGTETNGNGYVELPWTNEINDDRHSLVADQVRVLWMDNSESIHRRNELTVVDRGFVHGDYVASSVDPTGQIGLVVDVNMTVDLLAPDYSIVKGVPSRDLKRVRVITVGEYVISGPWLGRVDAVLDDVTLLFPDGSVCKIYGADPLRLRPIASNMLEDGHCPYHPGQRVQASSLAVLKDGRWFSGKWKKDQLEATVIKVTVGTVYVHWIASAGYGPESSISPSDEQSPKNLKLLSCFSHANWQLGDWCFFPSVSSLSSIPLDKGLSKLQLHDSEEAVPEESNKHVESTDLDSASTPDGVDGNTPSDVSPKSNNSLPVLKDNIPETSHIQSKKPRKILVKREKKPKKKERTYEKALLIVNTQTKVNVAWQDGTLQQGLDSTSLIPIESPGDHDFVAEQYVIEKAVDDDDEDLSETRRVGVIRGVDAKAKTACVNWLKQVAKPEDPREFEKEEIVSVYELEGHPDYDYCYGDVVVRLSPAVYVPTTENVCSDTGGNNINSNVSDGVKDESVINSNAKEGPSGEEACDDFSYLSWVGNITGLRNGDIEVTWADGMVSTVGPQAIYVVGRDDDDSTGGSESSDAASWETLEDNEMDALDDANKEQTTEVTENNPAPGEDTAVKQNNNSGINGPFGFAYELIRMASGIFSRARSNVDSESTGETESRFEKEIASNSQDPSVIDISDGNTNPDKVLNTEACSGGNACSFKRFDTAKDPLDHFFLGANIQSHSERKWLKKVQRDWTILQNNLPDGIYVRVYEDRMDLLRAVIVGAYGTPYQDGLFFFDFHLPPEYPDVPPLAHYHSGGWRINPNLYEEGKVCLSLLNTWTGRGNEVWDPQSSSILQVLVSLQGLVLNSRPYFNEAGYDKQVGTAEGEKNSLSYNENTFLLNCKTIMYLIRKPPKDFEDLVKEHFKQRGYYILKACDAYMKGYLISTLAKDALVTSKSEANATSVGFKLMLAKIVPKLISSLNKVGADCHEFEHLQES